MTISGGECARKVLVRLLESADRNATATRTLSVAAGSPKDPSPASQRAWRERLEGAERAGAVALARGAGNRREVIERVRLVDADLLARELGTTRAGTRAAAAITAARGAAAGRERLDQAIEDAAAKWTKGAEWYRLPPEPELVRRGPARRGFRHAFPDGFHPDVGIVQVPRTPWRCDLRHSARRAGASRRCAAGRDMGDTGSS